MGHEDRAARFVEDGLLVVRDGVIEDFGDFTDVYSRHSGVAVTHIQDRLILPGFIDGHIHFPQIRVLGSFGSELLDWIQTWIFPEELKYRDRSYARTAAKHFFDALLAGGTTTAMAFTTSSPVSTEEFFEEATRREMRVVAGLTGIDRIAPDEFLITPDDFYAESKRLIERYHRNGRNLYAITPRFPGVCTSEMMERSRQLKQEHEDCWVNTHISESHAEVRMVLSQYPDCPDYTAVHASFGLLGPKFVAGHGVWLSDEEFQRFSSAGAAIAFCPLSNLFLGNGLFRLGRALDPQNPVRVALGSDVGGGNAFTIVRVLEEAFKVGMCNSVALEASVDPNLHDRAEANRNILTPYRAFYLATLGAARALYLDDHIGSFDKGKEADFVVIDWNEGQLAMRWRQSLTVDGPPKTVDQAAQLLFGVMMMGDDRNVDETWIAGKRAYKKT
jgi:guanine deaminase